MRRLALLATIVFALAGCGGTEGEVNSDEVAGSNRPSSESNKPIKTSESSESAPPSEETPEPEENGVFGQTYTYVDGLSV